MTDDRDLSDTAGAAHLVDTEEFDPTPPPSRSILARHGLSRWDAAVLATAALNIVAFAPWLLFDAWTPRMALVVLWLPLSVAALVIAARAGDLAARLLVAASGAVIVSSLVSGDAWGSLVGVVGRDLSAVTLVGAGGLWAAGRAMSERGRRALLDVVVWAAVASAVVGLLQVIASIDGGTLALVARRPTGFAVNPVFFGAVCAGGAVVAAARLAESTRARAAPVIAVIVLASAVTLSGSRVALASIVVVVGALVVVRRTVPALISGGVVAAGLLSGIVIDRLSGTGQTATARLADAGSDGRSTVWGYGWDAIWDRPLLGHGVGRFRAAVQHDFSVDFVATAARDDLSQAWFDPHNAGILLLTGVGFVGAALVVAWFVVSAPRSAGPAAWGSVAIALTWTLQPVGLATLPLAALLFGAAGRSSAPRPGGRWRTALAVLGVVGACHLVVADALLDRSADRLDPGLAEVAAAVYVRDATVAHVVAQIHEFDADLDGALEWRRNTTSWGSDRPYWWSQRADLALAAGRLDEADRAIDEAYELQPNSIRTALVDARIAIALADEERLDTALRQLCALGESEQCDVDAGDLLDDIAAEKAASAADEAASAGDDR